MDNKKYKPLLRFNGFYEDWTVKKLGECTTSFSGGTPTVGIKEYYDGSIPFIRSAEVNSDSTELYISEKGLAMSSAKLVCEGDILYALYGATSGEVGICKLKGAINQAILAIKPQSDYNAVFLAAWLRKSKKSIIGTYLQGGQGNLSGNIVKNLDISLPTLPEQELIGNYFKHLDELINSKEKKIAKLKSIKAACLDKMFPKEGEAVPQLRFKGFNEDWVVKKLGEVIEVNSGRDYKHLSEGSIPVYGTGGYMLSVNDALSYKENAIGIGRKGTIDKPYILYAPFWTVDTLFYTIPKNGYNLNFIFDIFQNIDWKKKDESTGVPSLSKNAIIQIDISLPTLPEQELIGNYFKHLDELIEKSERQLEKLKSIKQGCLDKMFIND
jgi:type I restriction enzyme, S subunit